MPLSTDVRLPRTREPVFPDACCACQRPRPGDRLRRGRRFSGAWEMLFPWLWFCRRPFRCEVPVCAACRPALQWRWRTRSLVLVAAIGLAFAFVYPWAQQWGLPRNARRWLSIGLVLAAILPLALWQMLRPPAFDLTVGKDHVDYEFADPAYAAAFEAANRPADENQPSVRPRPPAGR